MATAHDVAALILEERGAMSAIKLQKLVYYSQSWHLVWEDTPLFNETVEAWANGPVVPELYRDHRGQYTIAQWTKGDPQALSATEKKTIKSVLDFYGAKTAFWLSELTHREAPWVDARRGIPPGVRSNSQITPVAMAEYYGSLV